MAITTTLYKENDEIVLVEVSVGGKPVGIVEEHAVDALLTVLGYKN